MTFGCRHQNSLDNFRFPELLALVASQDAFIRWAKLNSEVEKVASKQLYELFIHNMDSKMLTTHTVALAGGELLAMPITTL